MLKKQVDELNESLDQEKKRSQVDEANHPKARQLDSMRVRKSVLTFWYPPQKSWSPFNALVISPKCTEHPRMYSTQPKKLHARYTGWYHGFRVLLGIWFSVKSISCHLYY